jgi:hypothetical protein
MASPWIKIENVKAVNIDKLLTIVIHSPVVPPVRMVGRRTSATRTPRKKTSRKRHQAGCGVVIVPSGWL